MDRTKLGDGAVEHENNEDTQYSIQVEFESNKTSSPNTFNDGTNTYLQSCGLTIDFGEPGTAKEPGSKSDQGAEENSDKKALPDSPPPATNKQENDDQSITTLPEKGNSKEIEDKPVDLKQDENWTKRQDSFKAEISRLEDSIGTTSKERVAAKQAIKRSSDALVDWNRKNAELHQLRQEKNLEPKESQETKFDGVQAKLLESLKNSNRDLTQLDQREKALAISVACLQIASGDDAQIRKGEKNLLMLAKLYPSLQQDGQFHDVVLKSYIEMTTARASRGLPPWKVEAKLDDITDGDTKLKPGQKSSQELLKSANEKFWNSKTDEAIIDFNASLDTAKSEKLDTDKKRLTLFIAGLKKNVELAETVVKNKPDEEALAAKLKHFEEEQKFAGQSLEKSNFIDSVTINKSLAKIACGDSVRLIEGVEELKQQLEKSPEDALNPEFLENLNKAFEANFKNAESNKAKDKDKSNDEEKEKFGYKDLDLAKIKAPTLDTPVESHIADDITTAALTILGIGLAIATTRRTMSRLREQRVLNDLHEAKPLDGVAKNTPFNLKNADGTETKLEYRGRFDTSDRVVMSDPGAKGDWKKNQSEGIPTGTDFDLKAKKYGEFERLRVDGRDFFVDKKNKVHVEKAGKLYPTSEIRILTTAEFGQLKNTEAVPTPGNEKPPSGDAKPPTGEGKTPIGEGQTPDKTTDSKKTGDNKTEPEKFPTTPAEVCDLALKTDRHSTAKACVDWLTKTRPDGFVEKLYELAKSDSRAAIPALQALADRPASSTAACKLVMDRWNAGDFFSLMKENKVDLLAMQDLFNHERIVAPDIWTESWVGLADSPEAKSRLAQLLLNSVEYKNGRFWTVSTSDEVRQRAFDFVVENRLPGFEATLAGAAKMRQPGLSERAAAALERIWTSEVQPEKGIARCKFIEGDLIKRFSDSAKQLQWSDTAYDIERSVRDLAMVKREIAEAKKMLTAEVVDFIETNYQDPQMVKEKLGTESFAKDAINLLELTQRKNTMTKLIEEVRLSRENDLQKFANEFCKNNGLADTNLKVEHFPDAHGSYSSRTNVITVEPNLVLTNGGIQPMLTKVLLHELGHHEQSALIAKNLADQLGIEKLASPDQMRELLRNYFKQTGKLLSRSHAEQIITARDGVKLSAIDTARAGELILSNKAHADEIDHDTKMKELGVKLAEAQASLESNAPIEDTLKLVTEESAKSLLGVEHLPEELSKALKDLSSEHARKSTFAASAARREVRHWLKHAIKQRREEINLNAHKKYKQRFHEEETHAIDERTMFFSESTNLNVENKFAKTFATNHPILSLPKFQSDAALAVNSGLENVAQQTAPDRAQRDAKATAAQIESSFNEMLKKHNLPEVAIQETSKLSSNTERKSSYIVGKGIIQISSDLLANGTAEQITHEVRSQYVRYEQDRLVMMNAIEQNLKSGDSSHKSEYANQTGIYCDEKFYESVKSEHNTKSNGGKNIVLDRSQITYANEISMSLSRLDSDLGKLSILEGQGNTLGGVKESLSTTSGTMKVLTTLIEEQGKNRPFQFDESVLKTLFPDKVPEKIQGLIDKYKKATADGAIAESNGWTADTTKEFNAAIEEVCTAREKALESTVSETKRLISNNKLNVASSYGNYHDLAAIRPQEDKSSETSKESHSTKVIDLTEQAAQTTVDDRLRAEDLQKSEVVQKILKEAGMEERLAKELERKLTSADEKERESAVREIDKFFEDKIATSETTTEGSKTGKEEKGTEDKRLNGWSKFQSKLRQHKGRLATVVILTAPIVTSMMRQENSKNSQKGSTFSK